MKLNKFNNTIVSHLHCRTKCTFLLFADDLPIWGKCSCLNWFISFTCSCNPPLPLLPIPVCLLSGIVGEIGESKDEYYIWTHKKLDISYNNDQIVDVSLTSESKAKLVPESKLSFTYEVNCLLLFIYIKLVYCLGD